MKKFCWWAVALVAPVWAQSGPAITPNGIVNAASYTQPSFPGGGIAQGSLFTIFGSNLGPAAAQQANAYPLGTNLGGVTIKVTQGSASADAIPFYVSPTQVSAIMPSNAPIGADTVTLSYGSGSSKAAATVVTSSVGLFAINSAGSGPSVVQNYVGATSLPVNSKAASAIPGQTLILYGTGLGAGLGADNQPAQAGNLAAKTEIFVGGQPAAVSYSGRSPCCSGLDQFVIVVPQNTPAGCNVPIVIRTNGTVSSNVVTAAISADGSPCSDAIAPFGNITSAGSFGAMVLLHTTLSADSGASISADFLQTTFRKENGGVFAFNPVFSAPPKGSCTSYTASGNLFGTANLPGFLPTGGSLNPGIIKVSNTKSTMSIRATGATTTVLGSSTIGTAFLNGSAITVTGGGAGADIGAFSATVNPLPNISWTDFGNAATVNRANGLTVNWQFTGAGSSTGETVIVGGGNYVSAANTTAVFFCTASAADGTFTVPAYILGRIPAGPSAADSYSSALVFLGSVSSQPQATLGASGLTTGTVTMASANGRIVVFQ